MSMPHPTVFASLLLSVLVGNALPLRAADGAPPVPTEPAAVVTAWLDGLRRNELSTAWQQVPPTRQVQLADTWHADISRPDRMRDLIVDRLLAATADPASAKDLARFLAGGLGQFARLASGQPLIPAPAPAEGQRPDRMQMMQGMLARNSLSGLVQSVLADGLETRQVDALEALFADYVKWAAAAGFDDAAKQEAAATHLAAFVKALGVAKAVDLAEVDLPQLLIRVAAGLPDLKQALAVYGLDADAVLGSASARTEPGTGDRQTVVVVFTAFGTGRELPLAMQRSTSGWSLIADSPLARWLRPAAPRWNGGGRQGQGRPPQAAGAPDGAAPAAPAGTAPPSTGTTTF